MMRWPPFSTFSAIGEPIVPRPMKPTFMLLPGSCIASRTSCALGPALRIPHRCTAQVLRILVVEARGLWLGPTLFIRRLVERRCLRERAFDLGPCERLLDQLAVDHVLRCLEQRGRIAFGRPDPAALE